MQNGFSVKFSDFEADRLTTSGAQDVATPEGIESAVQIPIEYKYPLPGDDDKDIQARLVIECPMMRSTSKGIQPPKPIKGKANTDGKPAIQVVFDNTNPDHQKFIGTFGNYYEFDDVTDAEGDRTIHKHKNPVKATGVLGTIRDWCICQYAQYLADKKKKSSPNLKQLEEAASKVQTKIFWMKRVSQDGPNKGQVDESSNAVRYFKLMTYRPGTPEANSAKFCLQDGTRVDSSFLYGRCFDWTPFLSFRRIFDGATFTVQMEVTEAVINDFIETSVGMPVRTSRLVERLSKENPEQAAIVAEKYRQLLAGSTVPPEEAPVKTTGVKVDEIHDPDTETPKVKSESQSRKRSPSPEEERSTSPAPEEEESKVETSSRRRPALPRHKKD